MPLLKIMKHGPGDRIQGLTVLEVMILLSAIALIVLVAVPGSNLVLDKHRMKVATDSIVMGLELARSEANARSSLVVLCPSSNGHTCRSDSDWSKGWLVYSDGNGNGTVQDIELLQAFEAPSQKVQIVADGALLEQAAFTATGLVASNESDSGKFHICIPESKTRATVVSVDPDGWVQKLPDLDLRCKIG